MKAILPAFLTLFVSGIFISCNSETADSAKTDSGTQQEQKICIDRFLKADDSLGKIRNHACETISLSETILQYENALRKTDYKSCSPSFETAIDKHLDAWHEIVKVTDRYPDLRGEMHDLFSKLENGKDSTLFKPLLDAIWDTWAGVEKFIKQ